MRTVIGRESENRLHFVQGGECTTVFDLVSAKLVVNGFFTFFGDFRQKYDSFLNKHYMPRRDQCIETTGHLNSENSICSNRRYYPLGPMFTF